MLLLKEGRKCFDIDSAAYRIAERQHRIASHLFIVDISVRWFGTMTFMTTTRHLVNDPFHSSVNMTQDSRLLFSSLQPRTDSSRRLTSHRILKAEVSTLTFAYAWPSPRPRSGATAHSNRRAYQALSPSASSLASHCPGIATTQ